MKKRLKPKVLTVFLQRAGNVTRTRDLLITNQLLYRLSYSGISDGLSLSTTSDLLITNQLLYRLSYSGISDGLSLSTTSDLFFTNQRKQYHQINIYNIISQILIKRNKKHHKQTQNTVGLQYMCYN